MAKKVKVKKTLVDQILDKAKIDHDSLVLNALDEQLPPGIEETEIYKTLALTGDKTGPIIGIVPITEHLPEKKLAKISGNKKVNMIPQKDLEKRLVMFTVPTIPSEFVKNTISLSILISLPLNEDT